MNSAEVYFSLRGDSFDPDIVTVALGIEPSRTDHKSDPVPKYSSWILSSGKIVSEVVDIYSMSQGLVARFSGLSESIRALVVEHDLNATLQVVLTISSDQRISTPAIGFEAETVQFLASVGASVDVDTYRNAI